MRRFRVLVGVGLLALGCRENFTGNDDTTGTDDGECSPGMHGCACADGECLGDLVCLPDLEICAEPGETESGESTTDGTDTGDTGTTDDTDTTNGSDTDTGNDPCQHRVFASANAVTPVEDFADLEAADSLCQTWADAAALNGTFVAVLSGPQSARNRIELCGDVYLADDGEGEPDDTLVSIDGDWWSDQHAGGINRTENGEELAVDIMAWTGTKADGMTALSTCTNWAVGVGLGAVGTVTANDGEWINSGTEDCMNSARLYCIEQFE